MNILDPLYIPDVIFEIVRFYAVFSLGLGTNGQLFPLAWGQMVNYFP